MTSSTNVSALVLNVIAVDSVGARFSSETACGAQVVDDSVAVGQLTEGVLHFSVAAAVQCEVADLNVAFASFVAISLSLDVFVHILTHIFFSSEFDSILDLVVSTAEFGGDFPDFRREISITFDQDLVVSDSVLIGETVLHSFDALLFCQRLVLITGSIDNVAHVHSGHLVDSIMEFGIQHDCHSYSTIMSWHLNEFESVVFIKKHLLLKLDAIFFEAQRSLVQFTRAHANQGNEKVDGQACALHILYVLS